MLFYAHELWCVAWCVAWSMAARARSWANPHFKLLIFLSVFNKIYFWINCINCCKIKFDFFWKKFDFSGPTWQILSTNVLWFVTYHKLHCPLQTKPAVLMGQELLLDYLLRACCHCIHVHCNRVALSCPFFTPDEFFESTNEKSGFTLITVVKKREKIATNRHCIL